MCAICSRDSDMFAFFQNHINPIDWLHNLSWFSLLKALFLVVITYLLVRLSDSLIEFLSVRAPRARFFFLFLAPIVRFLFWGIATVLIASVLAPSYQTLIAILASVGLAIALGAQDLVKNLVGGLVILINRPYQLGDKVKIGDAYGEIDHIGILSTKLTTLDDTRVTIPNSTMLGSMAWNANSGNLDCQVVTDIYLPQYVDPKKAQSIAYEVAYSSPYLLLSKPVQILVIDHIGRIPALLIQIKAYVYDHRYEQLFQSDLTSRAKAEYQRRKMLDWSGTPTTIEAGDD